MAHIARRLFAIGSLAFIAIGTLHTAVHLTQMSGPVLAAAMADIGELEGVGATVWNLWQGLSLLMGLFSIALGCANLASLRGTPGVFPNPWLCLVNVGMLGCITLVGILYLGPIQAVGGPIGMVLFALPIVWRRNQRRTQNDQPQGTSPDDTVMVR